MQTLAARNLADIVSILKVDLSIKVFLKVYLKVYLYLKFATLKANKADIVSTLKVDLSIKVFLKVHLKVYLYLKFATLKANKADTTKTSLCKLNSALLHLILLKSSTGKDWNRYESTYQILNIKALEMHVAPRIFSMTEVVFQ